MELQLLVLIVFVTFVAVIVDGDRAKNDYVLLRLRNDSKEYISVYWVHPVTGETSLIRGDIPPDVLPFTLNSFLGHKFQVWQLPNPETGVCDGDKNGDVSTRDETCKIGYFEVAELPEQAFVIKEGMEVRHVSSKSLDQKESKNSLIDAIDLAVVENPVVTLKRCKDRAMELLKQIDGADDESTVRERINEELRNCFTVGFAPRIKASMDEVEFERTLRIDASRAAENYTCVNVGLETSPDVRLETWASTVDKVSRTVHVKLDRPASRIHVIEDFASEEECAAMEEEAKKDLHVASTADGKGGTKISLARKAMQAGIKPKFEDEDGNPTVGNKIADLSNRVYEYASHVLDMNITYHGQEPLMSIQYFGRGKHDVEPDRYTPHCDGTCTGELHTSGGRMATTVIYCTIPEEGGFTNFQNSNIHVKPNPGSAVFFSYIDPITNETDNGFTQHSGCPVYEGEKKIITQWIRKGVDKATPHNAFNTLGVLHSENGE